MAGVPMGKKALVIGARVAASTDHLQLKMLCFKRLFALDSATLEQHSDLAH